MVQMRQHCASTPQPQEHRAALITSLVLWAAAHAALHEVLQLPLSPPEEQVGFHVPLNACVHEGPYI